MEADEELMRAVALGDERALGVLVDRHAPRIHAFLVRLVDDASDADDLVQETWLRVARGAGSFDPARRFRPWLYGVAANLARDLQRRRRVRARPLEPGPTATTPSDPSVALDLRARLGELPTRLREVVLLRYFEDMSEAEMSRALRVPPGTVKSRLHAALRKLRQSYGGDG
jgi:RNA polymerase sigma-70 factor (ECF subfamily)